MVDLFDVNCVGRLDTPINPNIVDRWEANGPLPGLLLGTGDELAGL